MELRREIEKWCSEKLQQKEERNFGSHKILEYVFVRCSYAHLKCFAWAFLNSLLLYGW